MISWWSSVRKWTSVAVPFSNIFKEDLVFLNSELTRSSLSTALKQSELKLKDF